VPKLIYSYLASLDGNITDDVGKFDWAEPDEEVLEFIKRDRAERRGLISTAGRSTR
jgi:riboflavin biosynthesis pyrimidine reductase